MKWLHGLWLILIALAALAVILLLGGSEKRTRDYWATDSPAALEAFHQCLEADTRRYFREAIQYCQEALELDPDFAMAKMLLAGYLRGVEPEVSERLFAELRTTDLSQLTPRERFLIRHRLLLREDQGEDAYRLLSGYLQDYPDDPWAINLKCNRLWHGSTPEEAEDCYRRLLDADPNWVEAQNRLGYLAMARGQFEEAEEAFETYRYVAPDQANPHDSLGELLTLVGRYEDAEEELRRALSIRPDFCASYVHLVRLYLMQKDFAAARSVVEELEAQPTCETPPPSTDRLRCAIDTWELGTAEDWQGVLELWETCPRVPGDLQLGAHEAFLRTGQRQAALEIEKEFEGGLQETKGFYEIDRDALAAIFAHIRGNRLLLEEDPAAAATLFEEADDLLPYWHPEGLSEFKLFNQLHWMEALTRAGQTTRARQVLERVRAVNPRVLEDYEGPLPSDGLG